MPCWRGAEVCCFASAPRLLRIHTLFPKAIWPNARSDKPLNRDKDEKAVARRQVRGQQKPKRETTEKKERRVKGERNREREGLMLNSIETSPTRSRLWKIIIVVRSSILCFLFLAASPFNKKASSSIVRLQRQHQNGSANSLRLIVVFDSLAWLWLHFLGCILGCCSPSAQTTKWTLGNPSSSS